MKRALKLADDAIAIESVRRVRQPAAGELQADSNTAHVFLAARTLRRRGRCESAFDLRLRSPV